MAEKKSIEVTPEMEKAGVKALAESGLLENGFFKRRANPLVIRDIFNAMLEAQEEGDLKMSSDRATKP